MLLSPLPGRTCLLDTNILLYLEDVMSPFHLRASLALREIVQANVQCVTTVQSLTEFWVVGTKPLASYGLGLTPDQCHGVLARIEAFFPPLPEHPALYSEWKRLVLRYNTKGKASHDARIVAAAVLAGNVQYLLTNNPADFKRYAPEGISVLNMST